MKKTFFIIFFIFAFCSKGYGEEYYFKNCKVSEVVFGDYTIDINRNVIKVRLWSADGKEQKFEDKIKLVTANRVVSEIIQQKNKKFSTQYFLDADSKSVTRQLYKRDDVYDIVRPEGSKTKGYCEKVKADWEAVKKREIIKKKVELEEKKRKEKEEKIKKLEIKQKEEQEEYERNKNKRKISIISEDWMKMSEFDTSSGGQLKIDFDKKASEICTENGFNNFETIKQKIKIVEEDETPAFGLETVIKLGINGIIECK